MSEELGRQLIIAIRENTHAVQMVLVHANGAERERCECEAAIFDLLLAQSASLVRRFKKLDSQTPKSN